MALNNDRNTPLKDGEVIVAPVAAGAKIFAGSIVVANATGFATKGSTAVGLTYLGRADAQVDNTGGADGAKTIAVRRGKAFKFANSGTDAVTQADLGKTCYIEDDETVAKTDGTGTRSACGKVVGIEADGIWVE